MYNRRVLHGAVLFWKIISFKTPRYLCIYNKITFWTDVYRLGKITIPKHRTTFYTRYFSYQVAKVYNSLPLHLTPSELVGLIFSLQKATVFSFVQIYTLNKLSAFFVYFFLPRFRFSNMCFNLNVFGAATYTGCPPSAS